MKHRAMLALSVGSAALLLFAGAASTNEIKFLNSGKVLQGSLPFSEAVKVGDLLILSGQIGLTPGTMKVVPGGIEAEAKQTMENVKTSIEASGYKMTDVVKCTVMMADMSEWAKFNEIYRTYFTEGKYPARSAFGATGLAFNARVELECIASK
jgi:2-iminobutanoate/2-iminopropanoate deaminase